MIESISLAESSWQLVLVSYMSRPRGKRGYLFPNLQLEWSCIRGERLTRARDTVRDSIFFHSNRIHRVIEFFLQRLGRLLNWISIRGYPNQTARYDARSDGSGQRPDWDASE